MSNKGKKERVSFRKRLAEALDIPPDGVCREGTVEIRGRGSVSVREGGRILRYTPTEVYIAYGKGRVSILGRSLTCTTYCGGLVRIDGCVGSVVFEED